jgi:hypothetical protein
MQLTVRSSLSMLESVELREALTEWDISRTIELEED